MAHRTKLASAMALSLALAACVPTSGAVNANGYSSRPIAYDVAFLDGPDRLFLPEPWRLDNFSVSGRGEFLEKQKGDYVATRERDGQRRADTRYDLELINDRSGSVIWSKAHALATVDQEGDLATLADRYLDSLARSGRPEEGSFSAAPSTNAAKFQAFVKQKGATVVDGHPAITAVFDLVNAEKLRIDPQAQPTRVKIVFARFDYRDEAAGSHAAVLVVGCVASPGAFEKSVADLDGFVARVRFPR